MYDLVITKIFSIFVAMKFITKRKGKIPNEFKEYFKVFVKRMEDPVWANRTRWIDTDVYLMEDRGLLKIGKSYDYNIRFKTHNGSNKYAKIVKVYQSDSGLETFLHNKLNYCLMEGEREWFHIYDGIYEDIEKYVQEYEFIQNLKTKSHDALLESYPFKMFKFKEKFGKDYAYVIARDERKALEILLKESFIKVEMSNFKPLSEISANLDELIVGEEYVYKSTLKTRLEYLYCKKRGIDYYKEYGKTVPRKTKEEITNYLKSFNSYEDPFKEDRRDYWKNRNAHAIKRYYQ